MLLSYCKLKCNGMGVWLSTYLYFRNVSGTSRKCNQEHHSRDRAGMCQQGPSCIRDTSCIYGMTALTGLSVKIYQMNNIFMIFCNNYLKPVLTFTVVWSFFNDIGMWKILHPSCGYRLAQLTLSMLVLKYDDVIAYPGQGSGSRSSEPVQRWSNTNQGRCAEADTCQLIFQTRLSYAI